MSFLPSYIACHYLPHSVVPRAVHLANAYWCAKRRAEWIRLPYRKVSDTKPGQCWLNVGKAIDAGAGSMQCGWAFRIDPMDGNKNCLADIEAIPHAVWRTPEGELIEVSPDCRRLLFLPSDIVVAMLMLNVGFVDSRFHAESYRPANPFQPYKNAFIPVPVSTDTAPAEGPFRRIRVFEWNRDKDRKAKKVQRQAKKRGRAR